MSYAPPVTILGTGRNGSTYISKLLRHVGVDCGHEEWWTPSWDRRKVQLDADSSMFGYPFVSNLDPNWTYDGIVLTQVRHPLKTIASYVAMNNGRFMGGAVPDNPIWKHHVKMEPRLAFSTDTLYNSTWWWLSQTRKCVEVSHFWWKVEGLNPEMLQQICKHANWTIDLELCEDAMKQVRTDTHKHQWTVTPLTWEDLPDALRDECRELATELGYDPNWNG
jgi:hypothetical protein